MEPPTSPPPAYFASPTKLDRVEEQLLNTQPMSTRSIPPDQAVTDNNAIRLRGGCIPCPVSTLHHPRVYSHGQRTARRLLLHLTDPLLLLIGSDGHDDQ
jgi:hypothetical protein